TPLWRINSSIPQPCYPTVAAGSAWRPNIYCIVGTAARRLRVNELARMAGGQCPPKGGQLTTTAAMGNWSIIEPVIDRLPAIGRFVRYSNGKVDWIGGARAWPVNR